MECGCKTSNKDVFCHLGVFSNEEFETHRNETASLLQELPQAHTELEEGFSFSYSADVELYIRLATWASREHRCCPWANFKLELSTESINLTITGGGQQGKEGIIQGFKTLKSGGK